MPPAYDILDPQALSDAERERLRAHAKQLAALAAHSKDASLRISGNGDEEDVPLPNSFLQVIAKALAEMAEGRVVHVAAAHEELTTREAAVLLGVSRPYLVRLLKEGEIPFHKVGTHHRVLLKDALAYREKMRVVQERAFEELTRQAQELGLGYEAGEVE